MHRFYHPESLNVREIELSGAEAKHLARVLRLAAGDVVEVFDGRGQAVSAEISAVGKRSALLRVLGPPSSCNTPMPSIRLFTAAPKSDRLRWLVEKATELGVARLSLLQTRHSVVHPGDGKLDKLHAAVLAACKQCGRNDLMPIDAPAPWAQLVNEVSQSRTPLVVAIPGSAPIGVQLNRLTSLPEIGIAIGPEGGWDGGEIEFAVDRGAVLVGLGSNTLRIETAAVAAVSAISLCAGATR